MDTNLQLPKNKRYSAAIDARSIEIQLASLTESAAAAGVKTNLRCIARMFREHIDALDEAIKASVTQVQ